MNRYLVKTRGGKITLRKIKKLEKMGDLGHFEIPKTCKAGVVVNEGGL